MSNDLRKGMARHPTYGVTYRKRDFLMALRASEQHAAQHRDPLFCEIAAKIGCAKWSIKRYARQLSLQGYDVPRDKAVSDHTFTRERAVEMAKAGKIEEAMLEWTPDW